MVTELKSQGYEVTYRVRKDGGILITSIDGQRFKGAAGNVRARLLTGHTLSKRRTAQLTKITRERRVHPRKIPVETPADLERFRKRVMRKWRKAALTGSISKKNLRNIIEERGFEGAKTYLEEMERHTENKAYIGQLEALYQRINQDIAVISDDQRQVRELEKIKAIVRENENTITPEQIFKIFDWIYDWEMDRIEDVQIVRIRVEELLS